MSENNHLKLSDIRNAELLAIITRLKKTADVYGASEIGRLASDTLVMIESILDHQNFTSLELHKWRKMFQILKHEYNKIGGNKEFTTRLFDKNERAKMVVEEGEV